MFSIREQTQKEFQQLDILKLIEVGFGQFGDFDLSGQLIIVVFHLSLSSTRQQAKALVEVALRPSLQSVFMARLR